MSKIQTKTQKSLLLYFETCCVDRRGAVDSRRMNAEDFAIAQEWERDSFITFERIYSKDLKTDRSHFVQLSEYAWNKAHELRKERAQRITADRRFLTVSESSEQVTDDEYSLA